LDGSAQSFELPRLELHLLSFLPFTVETEWFLFLVCFKFTSPGFVFIGFQINACIESQLLSGCFSILDVVMVILSS
jgi:hypothetical protein